MNTFTLSQKMKTTIQDNENRSSNTVSKRRKADNAIDFHANHSSKRIMTGSIQPENHNRSTLSILVLQLFIIIKDFIISIFYTDSKPSISRHSINNIRNWFHPSTLLHRYIHFNLRIMQGLVMAGCWVLIMWSIGLFLGYLVFWDAGWVERMRREMEIKSEERGGRGM